MKDYTYNFVSKFVNIVCGLIVSVILARYLGVILRGELAFIIQTSTIVAIVLGLGVGQAFIRRFKLSPTADTFADTVSLLLLQGVVFSVLAIVVSLVSGDSMVLYIAVLSVATAMYQQFEAVMSAYNIRLKVRVHISYAVLRLLAHICMWFFSSESLLIPVFISLVLAMVSVTAYLLLASRPRLRFPSWRLIRELYGFGWLPMLTTLLILLNYNVDLIMLRSLGNGYDLGLYAAATGVVAYLWVVPDAVKEVLISRVVRTGDIRAVLIPLKGAVFACAVCIVILASTGWFLIPFLYGADFADSYMLIVILSLGVISMVYYKIFGVVVMSEGKRGFYFGSLLVAVLINVVLNIIVIPKYGSVGASWASVVSYSFTGLAFVWYFARISGCRIREILLITRDELGVVAKAFGIAR